MFFCVSERSKTLQFSQRFLILTNSTHIIIIYYYYIIIFVIDSGYLRNNFRKRLFMYKAENKIKKLFHFKVQK